MQRLAFNPVPPAAELAPFIRAFYVITSEGRQVHGVAGTHPPNGGLQLTLNFGAAVVIAGRTISPLTAVVSSPTERFDRVRAFGHVDLLNVGFRPAGGRLFLHCPLHELNGGSHDLYEFWPRWSVEALIDLASAPPLKRVGSVEALLLAQAKMRFAPSAPVRHATSLAAAWAGRLTVQQLTDAVNLSRSQLFRVFKAQVGIGPKAFLRVQRVRFVAQSLQHTAGRRSLATLAPAAGYFDQSHLIREFVQSTGLTPRQFLRREQEATFVQYLLEQNG